MGVVDRNANANFVFVRYRHWLSPQLIYSVLVKDYFSSRLSTVGSLLKKESHFESCAETVWFSARCLFLSSALGRSFNSDCVREAAIGGHYRVRCDGN